MVRCRILLNEVDTIYDGGKVLYIDEIQWKEPGIVPSSFQFWGTTSLLGCPLFSRHQGFS